MRVQLAVVYYSTYGTNYQIASIAAEAGKAAGAQVRLLKGAQTRPRGCGRRASRLESPSRCHGPHPHGQRR